MCLAHTRCMATRLIRPMRGSSPRVGLTMPRSILHTHSRHVILTIATRCHLIRPCHPVIFVTITFKQVILNSYDQIVCSTFSWSWSSAHVPSVVAVEEQQSYKWVNSAFTLSIHPDSSINDRQNAWLRRGHLILISYLPSSPECRDYTLDVTSDAT